MNPQKICQIEDDTGRTMTSLEMYERSLKFANCFRTKLQLIQHDIVGLITSNTENLTPIIFGCLMLGVAVNPLALQMGIEEIVYTWSNTKPKVIFCDDKIVETVQAAVDEMKLDAKIYTMKGRRSRYDCADDMLDEDYDVTSFDFPDLPDISSTIAFINCSSGTTGSPKDICKSHKQVVSRSIIFWDRNPHGNDVFFNLDQSYWTIHQSILIQCTLYDIPIVIRSKSFEPNAFMDTIDRHRVTAVLTSMAECAELLKNSKARKLESVRCFMLGGATFSEKLIKNLNEILPNGKVLITYGSTEGNFLSISLQSEGTVGLSSGYLNYNVQLKIVDDNGNTRGPNQVGEIYYKPAGEPSKFYNDPQTTAELFDADGFERSGDLGYFDELGQIYVLERIKNMIKSVDECIVTPMEVEKRINEIDGVTESRVVGVFDEKLFYDRIWAFVVRDEGRIDVTEEKIVDHMDKSVMNGKRINGGVRFIERIPKNCNGKVLYRVLKEMVKKIEFIEKN